MNNKEKQLIDARIDQDISQARELLNDGADPNCVKHGWTWTKIYSFDEMGEKFDSTNTFDISLLQSVVAEVCYDEEESTKKMKWIDLLLEHNVDVNKTPESTPSPLHIAAGLAYAYKETPAVMSRLIAAGANVNAVDDSQRTPIHWAARANFRLAISEIRPELHATYEKRIRILIDNGSHIDARDNMGRTPLHWAVWTENTPATIALLCGGADSSIQDNEGLEPIFFTVTNEYPHDDNECLKALLKHGADPNIPDKDGYMPIHVAMANHCADDGNHSATCCLLALVDNSKTNLKAKSGDGHTPLSIAKKIKNQYALDLLKEHGVKGLWF